MIPGNEIVAHNIKLLRTKAKLTQSEFGKLYDSGQKSVWAYEQGRSRPKPVFLLKLSRGTGITPEALMSVKLKQDKAGNLLNLPKQDAQAQALRKDLDKLTAEFEADVKKFFSGLEIIKRRIDQLEKRGK